ncbi:MAG: MetQ/NlpA family ABC transporter substrate-binding protein [Eubacteriales bacterium]|nr:MetQ/NlpA family ABC transporter substrate-binding protein [Clostridiales bacterium]MDD7775031.1 MetQ/NlpA family ABC transporter substrate-binding protein [Eubacteriales bacterium]MDY3940378.1 MetQ/NlpA family ABC transporter substrate-binding protein [Eubacteriales bacterium]
MKKLASLILAAALLIPGLASCGSSNADDKTITVAATSTPHAEILEVCKPLLEEKGYTLDIKVVSDYVTPNQFTEDGEVDANYFQHQPYLDSFNEENKTHLVSVAQIHYEPFAIYRGTVDSLAALPDGASIAVPNDTTNEARALQLLAAQGLITLKDGVGLTATKNDITDNPHNYDIKEMEAALLPTVLDEVAVAVINGNYALGAGLSSNDSLAAEDAASEAAQTFANVLVVKAGNENTEKTKALKEALLSDTVRDYITNTYGGAVVAIF